MRVLHLNTMLRGGGTDDQCVKLVAGLRKLGVDVQLMGPGGREFEPQIRANQIPQIVTPPEGPLKIHFMRAVAREIRRGGYDIIHAHHGRDYWPTFLSVMMSLKRPKIVFTRHLAKSPRSLPSRLLLLSLCDQVIAVSQFTELVMKHGFDDPDSPEAERHHRPRLYGNTSKIKVIPCAIDTDRFHLRGNDLPLRAEWQVGPEHFLFAVVGSYDHPRGKGQREFLKAAAKVHRLLPNARFLIIGRGTLGMTLQQDIERLGLQGKAFLTPYCHDMPKVMSTINCLVHPAIGTESFGLVLLEAFACGRPVIASKLDGIPEAFRIVGQGELVPPENVDALAAAMERVYKKGLDLPIGEREAMHRRVEESASLPVLARRTLELYQTLL